MTAQPNPSCLAVERVGQVTVVRFTEQLILTGERMETVGAELHRLVDQPGWSRLLINLANVQTLTSSMLGKLIVLDKKVQGSGGRLALCSMNEQLEEVFEVTQLTRLLNIYREEPEALQSF